MNVSRNLTYKIFDLNRNLENMGAPPKVEKPWKDMTMAERMEDRFAGIEFVEIELTGIPDWEWPNVRKLEGMLKGFYQAANPVLAYRLGSPELFYEENLVRALDLCQKQLSRLCELKKLADTILKKMERSRFLESHFERESCLVFGFKVEIQERSWEANALLRQLRDQTVAEEDFLPDPTLDPRFWRAKGTRIKETDEQNGNRLFIWGKEDLFCPGNGKRLASHRKTVRRLSRDSERRTQDRDRLKTVAA